MKPSEHKNRERIERDGYEILFCWTVTNEGTWMDFAAVEINAWDGETNEPIFWTGSEETNIDDNEVLLVEGFIKWDGCMEYSLGQQGQIHACGYTDAMRIAHALGAAYATAAKHMSGFDAELACYKPT